MNNYSNVFLGWVDLTKFLIFIWYSARKTFDKVMPLIYNIYITAHLLVAILGGLQS